MVELPYADDEVSMLLVIPADSSGLPAVEGALSSGWLEDRVASLVSALKALGMVRAFSQSADFSGVSQEGLSVVTVDEHGTTAAAATGVGEELTSLPPSFIADHPFLFVIRDRLTDTILFVGRVEDPTDPGTG